MELLRITRQIHCKAVEQRATLIHRQYNRDWGTSYYRPPIDPYLTPPCYKILTTPLFRKAMVATAPGEKLLIGCRSVRNWIRRTTPGLFLCRILHMFLGKPTKPAASRAALFDSNMHQIFCRLRLRPRPHCGICTPRLPDLFLRPAPPCIEHS